MAKESLTVGQKVWFEHIGSVFRSDKRERSIRPYEIVAVNKTSAYAVSLNSLDAYNEDPKAKSFYKRRITQRTHEIQNDFFGTQERLWLSPDAFEKNVAYNNELRAYRKQAHEHIDKLPLSKLKELVDTSK